jgi:hypothetical protein
MAGGAGDSKGGVMLSHEVHAGHWLHAENPKMLTEVMLPCLVSPLELAK